MYIFIKGRLNTLNQFVDSISEEIEDKKYIDVMSPDLGERISELDAQINEDTIVVTFNNEGIGITYDDKNYWDYKKVTLIDIIVDHSEYFLNEISTFSYEKFHFTSIDRTQVEYLKSRFPDRKDKFHFLPHGGTDIGGFQNTNRDIDILYVGNGINPENIQFPEDSLFLKDYFDAYYSKEKYPDIHGAIRELYKENPIPETPEGEFALISFGLNYVKYSYSIRRINLIKAFCDAGLKVSIIGGGIWNSLKEEYPDNIELIGLKSAEECLEYISRAKILLNDIPFPEGAHERVFNGMLNGAVVLTNSSRYLEERFNDWKDILYWDGENYEEPIMKIMSVLDDEELRKSIVYSGHSSAREDKWSDRLKSLLAEIKEK